MSRLALVATLLLAPACGDGASKLCADTTQVVAFPTPLWGAGSGFGPPPGDAAAALVLDGEHPWPEWYDQLSEVAGWPRRATIVVPLEAPASDLDPAGISFYGASTPGGDLHPLELLFDASLEDEGRSLLIRALEPAPAQVDELVLVLAEGAVEVTPLGACGEDGKRHPDYRAAQKRVPRKVEAALALPLPLSKIHEELEAIDRQQESTPSLTVTWLEAVPIDSHTTTPLPADTLENVQAVTASGTVALPDLLGESGWFELDGAGLPRVAGESLPGVLVALPKTGTAPYPVVLFQHGAEGHRTDLLILAGPLAAAGFALVGIDLPFHGDRGVGSGFLAMVDFASPLATRDAIRQAAVDQLSLLHGLPALNAALTPLFGSTETLDRSRVYFMGSSMGSISGSLSFAASPSLRGGAFFAGGAGFADLSDYGLFSYFVLPILERPPVERATVLGLMELMVEGADAFAYTGPSENHSVPPRPALFFQAIGDGIVKPMTTEALARAFGADLVDPFDHPVEGMEALPVPAGGNHQWSGGSGTRLLLQVPNRQGFGGADWHRAVSQQPENQAIAAACFLADLQGETCTVSSEAFAR